MEIEGDPMMGYQDSTLTVWVSEDDGLNIGIGSPDDQAFMSLSSEGCQQLAQMLLKATPAGGVYTTKSGRNLTESDLDALADEAERGYDVDGLTPRVPEQAEEVSVRLPPQVRAAVERRAEAASTSVSEIVRAALWVAGVA